MRIRSYLLCIIPFIIQNWKVGVATTPSIMRAIVVHNFGGPEALVVNNVTVPKPSQYQILVRVKAAGINPFDVHARSGTSYVRLSLPTILGKEIAGIVEETDELATRFQPGARVFCFVDFGGYAEFAVANETNCYPLSERLSFSQGAALFITYFTAYRGLLIKGRAKSHHAVLVHGASATLGVAAIQISKQVGAQVVASVGSPALRTVIQRVEPNLIINHDEANYLAEALDKLNRDGFNIIFEIIGVLDIRRDRTFLTKKGRIVVLGNRITVDDYGRGVVYTVSLFKASEKDQSEAATFLLEGIERGYISPIVGHEYLLEDAKNAHFDIGYTKAAFGKLVFKM